jgi:hypothetical protein
LSVATVDDAPALGAFTPNREQVRSAERNTRRLRKDPHRRRKYLRAREQTDRYGDLAEAGRARRRAMSWIIDHLTMAS